MRSLPVFLWHTLPLHYVPHLLYTGTLCSQAELKRRGYAITPRRTAARRDRKLRLDDHVHLSPQADTPLLHDKCAQGYPHALIAFEPELIKEEGVALCRYNAKSWRHREDFAPVTDAAAQADVWRQWQVGRYPSLEVLIPQVLPLTRHAQELHLPDPWAYDWLTGFDDAAGKGTMLTRTVSPGLFPGLTTYSTVGLTGYLETCRTAACLLPPPDLPFD